MKLSVIGSECESRHELASVDYDPKGSEFVDIEPIPVTPVR